MYAHNLLFFFFNDTATTEIYTLSLHDALPIYTLKAYFAPGGSAATDRPRAAPSHPSAPEPLPTTPSKSATPPTASDNVEAVEDRKSTRLNSSHANISYAVFCLKKKKKITQSPY